MQYVDFGLRERELEEIIVGEAEAALGPNWRSDPPVDGLVPALLSVVARAIVENNRRITEQLHAFGIGVQT